MPEEVVMDEPKKKEETKKQKKKEEPVKQPDMEFLYQDQKGNKLFRKQEGMGYRYFGYTDKGMQMDDQGVKQLMAQSGVLQGQFKQSPFQPQRNPFLPQQSTFEVPIYRAQMPSFKFVTLEGTPHEDQVMHEVERYQKVSRYMRKRGRRK
jgi:hypothetical protein